ncbi:PH domain-containing protein [Entamoeba marina]
MSDSSQVDLNVSVQSLQPSIFEAWAKKQGGSVKSWKRRWFVLKSDKLWYFKGKTSNAAQGYIELTPQTSVQEEVAMTVPGKKYYFSVNSRNQKGSRVFYFCVDNDVYLREFLKRIGDTVASQTSNTNTNAKQNVVAEQPKQIPEVQQQPLPQPQQTQPQQPQQTQPLQESTEKQNKQPEKSRKTGWVKTRPTISKGDVTDEVQSGLNEVRANEDNNKKDEIEQQMHEEEERKRVEKEIERQMLEQEELFEQEEKQRQEEESRKLEMEEIQRQEDEWRKQQEEEFQQRVKSLGSEQVVTESYSQQKSRSNSNSSSSDIDDGFTLTHNNLLSFLKSFNWISDELEEFSQLFVESIPDVSPTHITASSSPNLDEILIRCTFPLSALDGVCEFFETVGSPEDQIELMKTEAQKTSVLAIECWISLSEKGGCDAGWDIIAEQDSLDTIQALSDPSEIDSVGIIKLWCETNSINFIHRYGRDMGDQPPYNTEFWVDIPEGETDMIVQAATDFMFPIPPQQVLEACKHSRVMLKVITSEDGFVKFTILLEKCKDEDILNCATTTGEDIDSTFKLRKDINVSIEGFEYSFLNEGFGYDVYKEGEKVAVVFRIGNF